MRRLSLLVGLIAALVATVISGSVGEAATFSTFSTSSATVQGGKTIYTTVRLATAAPTGGQTITFDASNSYATVPADVTIAAGKTSASIAWKTKSVTRDVRVTLSATSNGLEKTIAVTLIPPALSSFSSPTSLALGASGTMSISLGAAVAADTVIALAADDPDLITMPDQVVVPTGSSTARVTITANRVNVGNVLISATLGSVTKTDTTKLVQPSLSTLSSTSSLINGQTVTGTVYLTAITYAAVDVSLTVAPSGIVAVPTKVTIPVGAKSATFSIATKGGIGSATITATYAGVTKNKVVTVKQIEVSSISITSSIKANQAVTGTVRVTTTAPIGGQVVTLSANTTGILTFPATVTVPVGATSTTFSVSNGTRASDTTVVVSAVANTVSKSVTVSAKADVSLAPSIISMSAAPSPAGSNSDVLVGVVFSGPVPSAGTRVTFSSSNSALLPAPAAVTVTSGYTSLITMTTSKVVNTATTVTLTASTTSGSHSTDVQLQPVAVLQVTTAQTSIVGPRTLNMTVSLTGPAPTGGATVSLFSNNSLVTVPATAFVPAGASGVNVQISALASDVRTPVTLEAVALNSRASTVLNVGPIGLQGFGTVTNPIVGGASGRFNITANTTAPTGGAIIEVVSSNPSVLQVPATVTLAFGGGTSVTPDFTTSAVTAPTNVTITASLNGSSISTVVSVRPAELSSIVVPTYLYPGQVVTGTVNLSGKAPAGGYAVTLSSSNQAQGSVPASVVVPEGQSSAAFQLTTPATVSSQLTITFTAKASSITKTDTGTLVPFQPTGISAATKLVHEGTYSGTVTINAPALLAGVTVQLASNVPAVLTVPSNVVIPAGQTSTTYAITTATVLAPQSVTITATANGISKTVTVTVNPIGPAGGGSSGGMTLSTTWSVELNGSAPAGGLNLALTYTYPLYGPATYLVPQGATRVDVPLYAYPGNTQFSGTVTATANGMVQTASRSPITVSGVFAIESASINGGTNLSGTVTYSTPAGPNGYTVILTSTNAAVIPSQTLTVLPGETSVTFSITSAEVTQAATLTLKTNDYHPTTSQLITVLPVGVPTVAPTATRTPTPTRTPTSVPATATPTTVPATETSTPVPTGTPVPTETAPEASPET